MSAMGRKRTIADRSIFKSPHRHLPARRVLDHLVARAARSALAGSWWTDWIAWLEAQDPSKVPAKGKRAPGGKGDKVIEDAPGRYVAMR